MTLLDKFRTQPRDKHPDAAVRLSYVEEIPLGERDAIAAIARDDEDPRVRKAAVSKLMDPAALGRIARDDSDDDVRARAIAMLRDIALDAFEGISQADSLDAVDAIADPKLLAQIAKSAAREDVALKALARFSSSSGGADAHALGSVARHAAAEAARRGAFDVLRDRQDRGEILAVGMNSEFKDTAVAAVDVVADDPALLEQIASKSRNKSASKRARGILREAEERATREAAEREAERREVKAREVEEREATEQRERAQVQAVAAAQASALAGAAIAGDSAEGMPVPALVAPDLEALERARQEDLAEREARERSRAEEEAAARVRAEADAAEAARKEAERREAHEAADRARREALARVNHLLARVEPLALNPDVSLKAADRALRDVRAAAASIPPLPSRQDFDEVSRRLKAVQAALTDKAHELRNAAEWRQWANAGVQEQLCVRMEALRTVEDPEAVAAEVRSLQQQWKDAADVPRAQADALWRRFKAAHDEAWSKCEAYFAAQAAERAQNLAKKVALCEKAESLADSTHWVETADAIKALQVEWKAIGPVSRGREKQIWDRFRSACDTFFTRRHQDLAERKANWAANFAKKEALVVKAEALASSTEWDAAAAEIKRLQNEWKTIGPVKKSRSEAIWLRFRGACDAFFARYAERHEVARGERVAAREAICAELEAIAAAAAEDPRSAVDILAAVRAIRGRWHDELAQRGVEPRRARELDDRAAQAFASVLARWPEAFAGTDLDPQANQKRMEVLVGRVEQLAASLDGPAGAAENDASLSPTNRLAAMLKEALAANTIGGKVDEGSRFRAAAEEAREAQASWARIGAVPDAARRALTVRFERACARINAKAGAAAAASRPAVVGRAAGPDRSGGRGGARR
jgi:Domain of Unknown Function (DUF349)